MRRLIIRTHSDATGDVFAHDGAVEQVVKNAGAEWDGTECSPGVPLRAFFYKATPDEDADIRRALEEGLAVLTAAQECREYDGCSEESAIPPLGHCPGDGRHMKMIGDVSPMTGEFMLSDAHLTRLAKGLRWDDGTPVNPSDAAEFVANALLRAGLLREHPRSHRFYKTTSAAGLDANEWNRAMHRAILDLSRATLGSAPPGEPRR
jgi:hypothetical protein